MFEDDTLLDDELTEEEKRQVYRKKLEKTRHIKPWKKLCKAIGLEFEKYPPLSEADINAIEAEFNVQLSSELKSIYREGIAMRDGDILPPAEAVKRNRWLRTGTTIKSLYMPFDHLFAFGNAANGDYWCLAYNMDNSSKDNVYGWNHENDSRIWVASSIRDMLLRLSAEILLDTFS